MTIIAENSILTFIILTCIIAGGAAWLTGRALAIKWRPVWQLIFYMALLGFAVRFFHFALFEGTLLSPWYYLVDTGVLWLSAGLGFRLTRARQMALQYSWIYERTGPFTWREKTHR